MNAMTWATSTACASASIGLFKAPIILRLTFGILGGIGPEVDDLIFMKCPADRLFGGEFRWSVLGAGAAQMPLASTASQMPGHVRAGPEDSLPIARGRLARSKAEPVAKIRRIIRRIVEDPGRDMATPHKA